MGFALKGKDLLQMFSFTWSPGAKGGRYFYFRIISFEFPLNLIEAFTVWYYCSCRGVGGGRGVCGGGGGWGTGQWKHQLNWQIHRLLCSLISQYAYILFILSFGQACLGKQYRPRSMEQFEQDLHCFAFRQHLFRPITTTVFKKKILYLP